MKDVTVVTVDSVLAWALTALAAMAMNIYFLLESGYSDESMKRMRSKRIINNAKTDVQKTWVGVSVLNSQTTEDEKSSRRFTMRT